VGGISGANNGTIAQCSVRGKIQAKDCVGGIAGNNAKIITQSASTATLNLDSDINNHVNNY
jgi:hypothetical protein